MILELRYGHGQASIPEAARGGAVSVGNFDGVHRGHAALIERLRGMANSLGGPAIVVTFDPHPAALLRPGHHPTPLTTLARRAELLQAIGVDHIVICRASVELLRLGADAFFEWMIQRELGARGIVEGPNFFFGRDREGTPVKLRELCDSHAVRLEIVQPTTRGSRDMMVSSTRIRELLSSGRVAEANELLTHPYRITGIVARGDQRGRQLGFPTANLEHIETLVPGHGVYATRLYLNGQQHIAATHVGPNPTFVENGPAKVEAHVLDFQGDLYGSRPQVDFLGKVRDIARFDSVAALVNQMTIDIAEVRRMAASVSH